MCVPEPAGCLPSISPFLFPVCLIVCSLFNLPPLDCGDGYRSVVPNQHVAVLWQLLLVLGITLTLIWLDEIEGKTISCDYWTGTEKYMAPPATGSIL